MKNKWVEFFSIMAGCFLLSLFWLWNFQQLGLAFKGLIPNAGFDQIAWVAARARAALLVPLGGIGFLWRQYRHAG